MDSVCSLQCAWFALHLVGLSLAILVRTTHRRRGEEAVQAAFLATLSVMALGTLAGRHFCWPLWGLSAGTLAVMVLAAVVDPGPAAQEYS
ncbi:MAG: hypothetical protein CMJ58_23730 [Planctomycetaceae bacterium]|nr:hypothetical protein [Planctomycetaceae bacterium]